MGATTGEHAGGDDEGGSTNYANGNKGSVSDAEAVKPVHTEKEVEMFIVGKNITRAGGSFFPCLNVTIFDLSKYGISNLLIKIFINIIAYILHYKQVGYQMLNYRS